MRHMAFLEIVESGRYFGLLNTRGHGGVNESRGHITFTVIPDHWLIKAEHDIFQFP